MPRHPPGRRHAVNRPRLEAMVDQETVEFRGRQKQLPVVGAAWRHTGEVFPKPDHQQTR